MSRGTRRVLSTAAGALALAAAIAAYNLTDNFLWQSISASAHTVTLDPDGGVGGTETVQASLHKPMPDITVPENPPYAFAGYWTGKNGTGTQYYTAGGTTARPWDMAGDRTLYAYWEEEGTITISDNDHFIMVEPDFYVSCFFDLNEAAFHFHFDEERLLNYANWNKAAQWFYMYHIVEILDGEQLPGGCYAVRSFRDTGLDIRDVTNDE
jgi:hypothetical protein